MEKLLRALSKIVAVITDHDRVVAEIAGMEFLITKHNKLGEADNVNILLDELDNLKIQLKVIDDLCTEFFGTGVGDLRFVAVSIRAGVEHHEELLTDLDRVRRTVEILEAAKMLDVDDGEQRDALLQSLENMERQVMLSLDALNNLIPEPVGEKEKAKDD